MNSVGRVLVMSQVTLKIILAPAVWGWIVDSKNVSQDLY